MPTMRRGRASGSTSPFRAIAHQQQASGHLAPKDSISLIRSFDDASLSSRPIRPSPLTASTIKDMPLDLLDRIRTFPLFMSAPDQFLVEIGAHLKPQIVSPNDHIVTEGDDARAMYWLVRGVVAVTSRDGEAVYAELKAGAFFGEIGVLMDMPRTATIVSRSKCLLLVLKKEDLQSVMPNFPEMEKAIREEATERLNLLKKRRQEGGTAKSTAVDAPTRDMAPGQVSKGETGVIRDGAVLNSKKRKSPSPGIIEDPTVGSVIGSGYVNIRMTLKDFPLFSNLPPDPLHFLGLSVQPRTYYPFNDIVRQGSMGNEIYFIVQGEAEVVHESAADKEGAQGVFRPRSRPRLKAGQYFGEVAGLGLSRGRTATVRSITTVECLMIPGDALDELWRRCPPAVKAQMEETAKMRFENKQEDVEMADADADTKKNKSDPSTPVRSTFALPQLTFTTPSKSGSPAKDDSEVVERKDPDPYLSVDMENLRSRRRHSLAPPTTSLLDTTPSPPSGLRSRHDAGPVKSRSSTSVPDLEMTDVPAKRAKTAPKPSGSSKIPSLSDEIFLKILEHMDVGQLMQLRCICGHWRRLLTSSPRLCHHLDLTHYNRQVTDQVLADWIAPFVGTRAITADLSNCFHITDEGFSALSKLCGKNIRQWKMRSVWDVSANQILDMAERAKGLEEVDWSNCRKVGDNLLCRVVGWVIPDTPPQNKQVIISSSNAKKGRSHSQQQRAHAMPPPGTVIGCPKLHTLNLSYCKHITDRSMAHLAAHASHRIRSLSLTRCTSISDNGFQAWTAYKFEKLTSLCLADCTYLTDNAIVALVNAAKNLRSLDLSFCCALSDTATEVVALGLPRLQELRLAFCGSAVSDASLESVALHLSDLVGISVRGCVRVTGKGVESILSSCPSLQWIDVSQCRNLEPWFNAGGVARWGYNERSGDKRKPSAGDSGFNGLHQGIRAMSVAMLTKSSFSGRAGGVTNRRTRPPVKFLTEKGFDGLR